jgi:hypothetical protein
MHRWHLMWKRRSPGGVHDGEQSALAGRKGQQELLIGKPMPGGTTLVGLLLQELLNSKN